METFSALLALCAGNSPVSGEFLAQKPVTRSFNVFFDLRFSKRLSKQSWGWWFETLSRPLWRHCNGIGHTTLIVLKPQSYLKGQWGKLYFVSTWDIIKTARYITWRDWWRDIVWYKFSSPEVKIGGALQTSMARYHVGPSEWRHGDHRSVG